MASDDRLKAARKFCYKNKSSTYSLQHDEVHRLMAAFAEEEVAKADSKQSAALSVIKDGGYPYGKLRKEQWEKSNEEYDLEEITHVPIRTAFSVGFDACADLLRELLAKD
jgi:hypothetical protein